MKKLIFGSALGLVMLFSFHAHSQDWRETRKQGKELKRQARFERKVEKKVKSGKFTDNGDGSYSRSRRNGRVTKTFSMDNTGSLTKNRVVTNKNGDLLRNKTKTKNIDGSKNVERQRAIIAGKQNMHGAEGSIIGYKTSSKNKYADKSRDRTVTFHGTKSVDGITQAGDAQGGFSRTKDNGGKWSKKGTIVQEEGKPSLKMIRNGVHFQNQRNQQVISGRKPADSNSNSSATTARAFKDDDQNEGHKSYNYNR